MSYAKETSWEHLKMLKSSLYSNKRKKYISYTFMYNPIFDYNCNKVQTLNYAKIEYFLDLRVTSNWFDNAYNFDSCVDWFYEPNNSFISKYKSNCYQDYKKNIVFIKPNKVLKGVSFKDMINK